MLTARTEVTDRMLIFGEPHLRAILAQYEGLYNGTASHWLQPQPKDATGRRFHARWLGPVLPTKCHTIRDPASLIE